ncbi:MAG: HD domain-containing protein [Flavobacteriaceae bacterium]|nr:HD domain-containing protein [Flavobacteriaceae bacterium]
MDKNQIIKNTTAFVQDVLKDAEGGHDWFHTQRVLHNALLIAKEENVDEFVVTLGALLHDIADAKFNDGDETIGPKKARTFLKSQQVDEAVISHVENIIKYISFKNSLGAYQSFSSKELDVVQDADRLDAIGAIGIARAFNYGGFKNRTLYDPGIAPNLEMTKEAYKKSTAPTVNHFYEKLFLLKDKMNTNAAWKIAAVRHNFMERFLEQFYAEWNGEK